MASQNNGYFDNDQYVDALYLSFGRHEVMPEKRYVLLGVTEARELRFPLLASLIVCHMGENTLLGMVRVDFDFNGFPGQKEVEAALADAAENRTQVEVPAHWPVITWFDIPSDYEAVVGYGHWKVQQVLTLTCDLTYAIASGGLPVWYIPEHHQHLFQAVESPYYEEEYGVIIDMFRARGFEKMARADYCLYCLSRIEEGREKAAAFEHWVAEAFAVLFEDGLPRVRLHPNGAKTLRRDIVATNSGNGTFFRRLLWDYGTRMVVIEAKNYSSLLPGDFRQVHAYLGAREYGRIGFLVTNSSDEELDSATWEQVRTLYYEAGGNKLVWVMSSVFLARLLRVLLNGSRDRINRLMEDALDDILLRLLPH